MASDSNNPYRPPQDDGEGLSSLRPPKPLSVWILQGLYALMAVTRFIHLVRVGDIAALLVSSVFAAIALALVIGIQLRHRWAQWVGSGIVALFAVFTMATALIEFQASDRVAFHVGELLGSAIVTGLALLLVHKVAVGPASRDYFSHKG